LEPFFGIGRTPLFANDDPRTTPGTIDNAFSDDRAITEEEGAAACSATDDLAGEGTPSFAAPEDFGSPDTDSSILRADTGTADVAGA
jgi:hypothetical protein